MEHPDRRQEPRVVAGASLHAELVPTGLDCRVLDVSYGGFLIESPVPFSVGEEHEFLVTTADRHQAAVLTARAVYCHRRTASETAPTYASGFCFSDPEDPSTRQVVFALLDRLNSEHYPLTTLTEFIQFWQPAS